MLSIYLKLLANKLIKESSILKNYNTAKNEENRFAHEN